ncbi:MAG: endolytic transglycosylase MltG [Gammaproteobacteria bacterium]|nr:MAG: endolytic transglycosylase MltG [Gammaproteobacteria bacterium]
MKRIIYLFSAICVFTVGVAAWLVYDYTAFTGSSLGIGMHSVKYIVPVGSSMTSLSKRLEDDGIISNRHYFGIMARFDGTANQIKAGEYDILPGMNPRDLMQLFVKGKVKQYSLTIVEGRTFKQLLADLHNNDILQHDLPELTNQQIMEKIGAKGQHPEGMFYPDTYYFPRGTSESQFLKRAYWVMQNKLAKLWDQREKSSVLKTPYEALILASIIEKETAVAAERQKIAGVFIRRLKKGMRLQTDPTVIYGMGDSYNGDIRFRDLKRDTPYNTYTRKGLPPTPIAMAGEAAIYAALHPAKGNELYFVARNDGTHVFSDTLKKHNRAVDKYQRKRNRK